MYYMYYIGVVDMVSRDTSSPSPDADIALNGHP